MDLVEKLALALIAAHRGDRARVIVLCQQCLGICETHAEVDRELLQGSFINAIKLHRAIYGTELKASKDACERRREELRASLDSERSQ